MCRGYDFSNNSITVLILQQFKLQDNQQTTGLLFGTWSFAVPTVPITSSDANTRCVVGTSTSATMEPIISSMRPESTTNIKLQNTWRPLSSPHQISWLYPDLSRCLRHTGDSIQIGLHVVVSEQESMCEHIVHSKSSEIIVLDNINLFFCIVSLVKALILIMIKCPSRSCHLHLTELRQSGYAYSVTIAIVVTHHKQNTFSLTFSTFPVKFPDFSRFSWLVAALRIKTNARGIVCGEDLKEPRLAVARKWVSESWSPK